MGTENLFAWFLVANGRQSNGLVKAVLLSESGVIFATFGFKSQTLVQ